MNWSNGELSVRMVVDVTHEQIVNLFTIGFQRVMGFWISGIEGQGIYEERSAKQQIRRWNFKNRKNGEFRKWPIMAGQGEHGFYKNGRPDGERAFYHSMWNGDGKEIKRLFYKDDTSYTIEEAEELFPEGPWLRDAKFTKQLTNIKPLFNPDSEFDDDSNAWYKGMR